MKIVKSLISFAVIMIASFILSVLAATICLLILKDVNLFFSIVIFGTVTVAMSFMTWCQ